MEYKQSVRVMVFILFKGLCNSGVHMNNILIDCHLSLTRKPDHEPSALFKSWCSYYVTANIHSSICTTTNTALVVGLSCFTKFTDLWTTITHTRLSHAPWKSWHMLPEMQQVLQISSSSQRWNESIISKHLIAQFCIIHLKKKKNNNGKNRRNISSLHFDMAKSDRQDSDDSTFSPPT